MITHHDIVCPVQLRIIYVLFGVTLVDSQLSFFRIC